MFNASGLHVGHAVPEGRELIALLVVHLDERGLLLLHGGRA